MVSAAPAAAAAALARWEGGRSESRDRGDGLGAPRAAAGPERRWVGRSAGRRRRADGSRKRGAPGSSHPEPPRLWLTIGSGRSAPTLIGAGTSRPRPGAGWEMESMCLPQAQQHAGSCRRRPAQSRNAKQTQEAISLLQGTLGKGVWCRRSLLKKGDPQLQIFND